MELSARLLGFTTYGVQWVLWLLIGLSVISIGMMLERLWHFATYRPTPAALAKRIRLLLESGPPRPEGSDGAGAGEALAGAVEGAKAQERLQLERNLAFLGTLGSNAPFIGLFGTVLGIIKAFHDLAGNQAGGPAVVMSGISEALVATAVGLLVAIPAVVAFNYFNRRVRTNMTQVDWIATLALAEVKAQDSALGPRAATDSAASPQPVSGMPPVRFLWTRLLPAAVLCGGLLVGAGVLIGRSGSHRAPPSLESGSAPVLPPAAMIPGASPAAQAAPPSGGPAAQGTATGLAAESRPAPTPPLPGSAEGPAAKPATPEPSGTPEASPPPLASMEPPATVPPPPQSPPGTASQPAPGPKGVPESGLAGQPGAGATGNKPAAAAKPVKIWKGKKRRPGGPAPPAGAAAEPHAAPAPHKPEESAPARPAESGPPTAVP